MPVQIGKFRVLRQLGSGAMGAVFLARHPGLGQEVAVKVLHDRDPEVVARFRREAEIMARIKDPGVVEVFEAGVHEGQLFLAMEYVQGQDLAEQLKERGALPPAEAVGLMAQVSRGVEAAHQAGVIHRDLKPANILLDASGRPKVTDFGISSRAGPGRHSLTETGVLLGTPAYMAPEQALDARTADARSDVYALGVILHECLSGQRAFRGASGLAVLTAVVEGDAAPLPSGLPQEVVEVVRVAMALDPGDRFTSAGVLAESLEEIGEAGNPRKAGVGRFLGVALTLALLGGLLGWGLLQAGIDRPSPAPSVPVASTPLVSRSLPVASASPTPKSSPGPTSSATPSSFPPVKSADYYTDKRRFWGLSAAELGGEAARGHPAAQARLGSLAMAGRVGLPKEQVKALLLSAAEAGDPEAMLMLAAWHGRHKVVAPRNWAREAAEAGSGSALRSLGRPLSEARAAVLEAAGRGDPTAHGFLVKTALEAGDREEALSRLDAGIAFGIERFRAIRARLLRNTPKANYAKSFEDFQAAAHLPEGKCGLARSYALGLGVKQDRARARKLIQAASEQGYPYALFELVYVAEGPEERAEALRGLNAFAKRGPGEPMTPDFLWGELALYLLEVEARSGRRAGAMLRLAKPLTSTDARVPLKLGILILMGETGRHGFDPMTLFERAWDLGHVEGLYASADCLLLGRGAPRDVPRGLRLMKEAGRAGSSLAWNRLGLAYAGRLGLKIKKDPARALKYFLKAAEGGYPAAMLAAAERLEEKGDLLEARRWTLEGARRMAASDLEKGDELASREATEFLATGTYRDAIELLAERADRKGSREGAKRWSERGRAQDPPLCLALSARLERGQESSNWKQVADWYRQAHSVGDPEGRFGLARCLAHGRGVERDLRQAKQLIEEGRAEFPQRALLEDVVIAARAGERESLGALFVELRELERRALPAHEWGELGLELLEACSGLPVEEARPISAAMVLCFRRAAPATSVDPRVPFVAADLVERGVYTLPPDAPQKPGEQVTSWYGRAANLRHGLACRRLAQRLIHGVGTTQNVGRGLETLRTSAELGEISAWEVLGDLYREGLGPKLKVNLRKAEAAYQRGADASFEGRGSVATRGRLYAKLGGMLLKRKEVMKKGIMWLERGVELKAPLAEIGYGACLLFGRGVKRNAAQGLARLEPHAASYVLACEALAMAYRQGAGVVANPDKAREYAGLVEALRAQGAKRWPGPPR